MAKSKKKYPIKEFNVASLPHCCGIGEVGGFEDEYTEYDWSTGRKSPGQNKFATKEEQAEDCYKRIVEKTGSGDDYGDCFFSQLLISLVSHYGDGAKKDTHQWPELEDILIREGWTIFSVFINPNHGNEVTLYGKYFPDRIKHPDDMEEEEEDEWV